MDTQTLLNVSKSTAKLVGLSIDIVKGLTLLCQRYKDEQLILQSTAAQVTVLSAALSRIEELAKSGNAVQYHQLAIDLGNSLLCCGLLLARLDQDVSELEKDALQGNISARLKTAFNGGPAIEIQAMIDRQANALTLLLTAYSCQSLSDQGTLLRDSKNRSMLDQVQEDGLSLKVHRDSSSILSQTTGRLSKLSREFTFDQTLLSTKVYSEKYSMLIQLLRRRIQRNSKIEVSQAERMTKIREMQNLAFPKKIDERIKHDQTEVSDTRQALVTGLYPQSTQTLVRLLADETNNEQGKELLVEEVRVSTSSSLDRLHNSDPLRSLETQAISQPDPDFWVYKRKESEISYEVMIYNGEPVLSAPEKWLLELPPVGMLIHIIDLAKHQEELGIIENLKSEVVDFVRLVSPRLRRNQWILCLALIKNTSYEEQWPHLLALDEAITSEFGGYLKCRESRVSTRYISRDDFYAKPGEILEEVLNGHRISTLLSEAGFSRYTERIEYM